MKRTDTQIHFIELLLTLDYLLHNTDENNPATQQKICAYAQKYNLKYSGGKAGDDIKRQRISNCLSFLEDISIKYPDALPFILETTESGKYYIEQRNGLDNNQVAQVLAALKNDKYTSEEDAEFLMENILNTFSTSDENSKKIMDEFNLLNRGVKKYCGDALKNAEIIRKAYQEKKLVKVKSKFSFTKNYTWHRVCFIKQYDGKLFAFLLPLKKTISRTGIELRSYIFEPITNIDILKSNKMSDYLCDDFEDNRDLNELYKATNPRIASFYKSLDEFVSRQLLRQEKNLITITFIFSSKNLHLIKRNFEEHFGEKLSYSYVKVTFDKNASNVLFLDSRGRKYIKASENEAHLCCGTIKANINTFAHWYFDCLNSDEIPNFVRKIDIISPSSLKSRIASLAVRSFTNVYYLLSKDERSKMLTNFARFNQFHLDKLETSIKTQKIKNEDYENKRKNRKLKSD